jgi:hypothetical protein
LILLLELEKSKMNLKHLVESGNKEVLKNKTMRHNGHQWLMPVILATQEVRSGGLWFEASWANSSRDPMSKIFNTKRVDGMAQGIGPESKPQYHTYT